MPDNTQTETIKVSRIIDAPIDLVWKAWTEPEHVMRWWGPQYYTSPTCEIDLREGGKYVFCMRAPKEQGGQDSYTAGVYTKIVPMERLEFTQGLSDKDGNRIDPASIGMSEDFPEETHTAVIFEKFKNDMTKLTIMESGWKPSQMMVFSIAGLHQTADKLIDSLAKV